MDKDTIIQQIFYVLLINQRQFDIEYLKKLLQEIEAKAHKNP